MSTNPRFFTYDGAPHYRSRQAVLYERRAVTDVWNKLTHVAHKQWKWKNVDDKDDNKTSLSVLSFLLLMPLFMPILWLRMLGRLGEKYVRSWSTDVTSWSAFHTVLLRFLRLCFAAIVAIDDDRLFSNQITLFEKAIHKYHQGWQGSYNQMSVGNRSHLA